MPEAGLSITHLWTVCVCARCTRNWLPRQMACIIIFVFCQRSCCPESWGAFATSPAVSDQEGSRLSFIVFFRLFRAQKLIIYMSATESNWNYFRPENEWMAWKMKAQCSVAIVFGSSELWSRRWLTRCDTKAKNNENRIDKRTNAQYAPVFVVLPKQKSESLALPLLSLLSSA